MKPFYKIIILAFLILVFSVSLSKPIYESFVQVSEYKNFGCNGDTFEGCVKNKGVTWCAKNCRNAFSTSPCISTITGNAYGTWGPSIKQYGQEWAEKNCKSNNGDYAVGIKDIL
jgi:hypothetical protein